MADEKKGWSTGKIVGVILASLVGLGILCCGIGGLVFKNQIKQWWGASTASITLVQRLQAEYGPTARFNIVVQNGETRLVVGIPADRFDASKIAEDQDKVWRIYAESFAAGGLGISGVALGKSGTGSNDIADAESHFASAADLAARTGVPAPPTSGLIPHRAQPQTPEKDEGGGENR